MKGCLMDSEDSDSEEIPSSIICSSGLLSTGRYSGGRIMRIKLVNFMVYDKMEIFPGPGLNLIIGPNGSGKSTTVCGICLGLAGKTGFTGRKMRIGDYVKNGKSEASIEIELDDPSKGRNMVFKRTISSTGTSQYRIDNCIVKENVVEKEVARFNIQMNNLCQFLPQERVSEFSKMNAIQLLESMQQAVGDEGLFKSHNELKNLRESCRKLEADISTKESHVISEKKKNERIETEAQIYAEIQQLTKQREMLEGKVLLLRYKETHEEMHRQKKKKKRLLEKENEFQRSLKPIREELEAIKNSLTQYSNKLTEKTKSYTSSKRDVAKIKDQIQTSEDKIYAAYAELQLKIEEQNRSQERIKGIECQLEVDRDQYNSAKDAVQQLEGQQNVLLERMKHVTNEIHAAVANVEETKGAITRFVHQKQALEMELQKLSGIEHKKLKTLEKIDLDTYNGVLWLRDNRSKFRRQVYDPILMMIDTPSEENIKYIEAHIPIRDLTAFVCEDKDDSRILVEKLRTERKLAINTVLAPSKKPSEFLPKVPSNELKQYFLSHYVKDIFKAPGPIVSYLCEIYNIHNTPIGNESTERHLNDITNCNKFSKFYTKDRVYTVKRSRYGARNISVTNSSLRPPRYLTSFTNTTHQQKQTEDKIKETDNFIQARKQELQKFQVQHQNFTEELETLRRERKAFSDKKTNLRSQELLIIQKENNLKRLKEVATDIAKLKKMTEDAVAAINQEKINNLKKNCSLLNACCKAKQEIVILQLCSFAMTKKQQIKEEKLKEEEEAHRNFKLLYREVEQEVQRLKQLASQRLNEAEVAAGIKICEDNIPALTRKFGDLDKSVDDVNSEIHNINAKICCFGEGDKAVYDEHQKRKGEILRSEEKLKNAKFELETMKNEIQRKKGEWLTPLNALIEKISKTFSKYFMSLGCAGELGLKINDNPDDFDKYGLSIRVKFRDKSPLQELSHAHHSGGECSVSTIIFILALQKLTEVPFRCVDEINQGMDSVNERRIFELVSMSSGNSSQYFLLTPKLLPNLTYPKEMKVHIIKNAPAVHENMDWTIDNIIENLKLSQRCTSSESEVDST